MVLTERASAPPNAEDEKQTAFIVSPDGWAGMDGGVLAVFPMVLCLLFVSVVRNLFPFFESRWWFGFYLVRVAAFDGMEYQVEYY